ncbi:hypothetical protein [uncultured Corynebacterium sp.]|uniref:hypothetical protein n=1 Tax=uncultured Corynebacterium sp. TaxID=159447 RepID=UPI0025F1F3F5|nr:hypothetical protein [uncultured Corynebacterium sp.]
MTIKKSLLAAATATTVAIAGAGGANAAELPTGGNGSSTSSLQDAELSDQFDHAFGSQDAAGKFNLEQAVQALLGAAVAGGAVAGSIAVGPAIYDAVKDFQGMVDGITADTQAFIESFQ